jgi:hypothetical protein
MSGLPKRFPDRDEIAAVRAEAEAVGRREAEETCRLAGRVMARRDLGSCLPRSRRPLRAHPAARAA